MKVLITFLISILFFSNVYSQKDLLPAFLKELTFKGEVAYFNGSPFTGILVEEKTNKKIGEFKNGYKEGLFIEKYPNGNKKSEKTYRIGELTGIYNEWFDNKQLRSSYNYSNGNLVDGKYVIYNEDGRKEREENYLNNKMVAWGVYQNDKLIESCEFLREFYSNGQMKGEGWLKNKNKDGQWTYWYDTGEKKSDGFYKDGNQVDTWISWLKDGNIEYEGELKNDLKEGQGIFYSVKNGITYKGGWVSDKRSGYGTITLKDGSINFQGEFKNGVIDGYGTIYDKGKKVYIGDWKNGKMHGKGTYYYENEEGVVNYSTGDFVDGKFEGQGAFKSRHKNGVTFYFRGEFMNWQFYNGTVYWLDENGFKFTAKYINGEKERTIMMYESDEAIMPYFHPSLKNTKLNTIALFPLNTSFIQANIELKMEDNIEINNMFRNEFLIKNPKINLLEPSNSLALLKNNNLETSYDTLVTEYNDNTNLPNREILRKIGNAFKVDAILQGLLLEEYKKDGHFINPSNKGVTKLTVKYVLISTITGEVLWEVNCVIQDTVSSLKDAPSVSDILEILKEELADAWPLLAM